MADNLKNDTMTGLPDNKLGERISGLSPEQRALLMERLSKRTNTTAARITPRTKDGDKIPLSFAQERLWFLYSVDPVNPAYNVTVAVHINGKLDIDVLQHSLNQLVERHASLRTTLVQTDDQPVQHIAASGSLPLEIIDLRGTATEERWEHTNQIIADEARKPFQLLGGSLVRTSLLRLAEQEYVQTLSMHHAICDGWSAGVLVREVAAFYSASLQGVSPILPKLPVQFGDYAIWQREWLNEQRRNMHLAYWREQLRDAPAVMELPTDFSRPPVRAGHGQRYGFVLPADLADQFKTFAQQIGSTPFVALLTVFKMLLYRYTNQSDLLVGSPVHGREQAETQHIIGCLINMLVLRSKPTNDMSFRELLYQVRETVMAAYKHQDLPFEQLIEALQPGRNLSHTPLFQATFALHGGLSEAPALEGATVRRLDVSSGTAKYDLSFELSDDNDGLKGWIEYNTELFTPSTISRMADHFRHMLEQVVDNPDQRLATFTLVTELEREQLLDEWNATHVRVAGPTILHKLFEKQAAATPNAMAVHAKDARLTYHMLDQQANQLAHYLRARGVGPEVLVGINMQRSVEVVVAMLGVLKAGGAYVPLDPTYPQNRLAFMVADAGAPIVLTHQHVTSQFGDQPVQLIDLNQEWEAITQESVDAPDTTVRPEHPAYVIYTSGSTGNPKGVVIPHSAICNYTQWSQRAYPLYASDRVLQKTALSFDVSVAEFYPTLLVGAQLVMAEPDALMDGAYLAKAIREWQITTLYMVPSVLQLLVEQPDLAECNSLRWVFSSGEALSSDLATRAHERLGVPINNLYGPTETTIHATFRDYVGVDSNIIVSIGCPMDNLYTYVLDTDGQLMPIGIPGELYIGGKGLAREYRNRPELTAERFVPDPFSGEQGARMYRTGDLVHWQEDGTLAFLKRIDHQVKLRGYRIELGEIESVLHQHQRIQQAIVLVRPAPLGEQQLIAYIVPDPAGAPRMSELRSFVAEHLPEYMRPSSFVVLPELPLMPNGKLDKDALPTPTTARPQLNVSYEGPTNAVEHTIAQVWQEMLGVERIGIHDNFFDLGSHSLLMVKIHARLQTVLEREFPVLTLFKHPTIASLARHLSQQQEETPKVERTVNQAQRQRAALQRQRQRLKERVSS